MKKVFNLIVLVCFLAGVAVLHSCKKDPVMPTLTTVAVTDITTNSASSGGNITDDGGADVTARGVCWGTATNPTITGSKTNDGTGIGSFASSITGLTPNTLYYVRSFATNSAGTAYGNEVSFTTDPIIGATVTTAAVTVFAQTTATAGGNVTLDGGAEVTERGVYYGTGDNPGTTGTKISATAGGLGTFNCSLTGLTPGTLYYVVAYATNSSGTTFGSVVQFTTAASAPTVTTAAVTVFTQTTATAGGNVTANGGADVTERGVYYGTAADPATTGTKVEAAAAGSGAFTCSLTSLTSGTQYHVVAYATNSAGTSFGSVETFTTSSVVLATVTTTAPVLIATSSTSVTAGGNVGTAGGGTVTERGVCYSTTVNPDYGDDHVAAGTAGTGSFQVTLPGLSEGTIYYVRAYAINSAGTAYGTQMQILTMVSDEDDNIYSTVLIDDQIWMAENLNTTHFNNGNPIDNVTGDQNWADETGPAYCYYQDDPDYGDTYGAFYNYYAINTGQLCPIGWSVPTDEDFKILEMNLGMTREQADAAYFRGTDEGAEMKTTTGWNAGVAGTNTSGFSALPGGYRFWETGESIGLGGIASFGTSTGHSATTYIYRQLWFDVSTVFRQDTGMAAGFSVRCLKD